MQEVRQAAIREVLEGALQRETEAFNYYHKASKKAPYPETEALLIQLAEEERKHRYFVIKELERIESLFLKEGSGDFIFADEVQYQFPEEIVYKRVEKSREVDVAATSLPAELLGGDFLDTIALKRKGSVAALGVFLYDVMGHGVEATHLKALAKQTFGKIREEWAEGKSKVDLNRPEDVVGDLNKRMFDHCQLCRRFVSVFYGIIDPLEKVLIYSSAGHEPPVLVRHDREYAHLDSTNLVLGVDRSLAYTEERVPLDTGDVIVLFSDGITEAMNARYEMFTRERLRWVVQKTYKQSAQEITKAILDALRSFLDGQPVTDECSLAVMKLAEPK